MWLSSTAQDALRAVLHIADQADNRLVRVDEIAVALDCPRNYLSKTLHALTRAGVLRSERGPKGGFQLATPPESLPIALIVAPFEPVSDRRCLFGRPECGGRNPCAAHHRWSGVASGVTDFFSGTMVSDLRKKKPAPRRKAALKKS